MEPILNTTHNASIHSSILWLIPFLPAFGAIINGFIGRWLKNIKFINIIALGSIIISFAITIYCFIQLLLHFPNHRCIYQTLWTWLDLGCTKTLEGPIKHNITYWAYRFDALSSLMALLITGVGFLIHLFSIGYMKEEQKAGTYYRFMAYLNLFVFSMLNLVLGANMIMMFLGWEGVGLCSYLLIGFYYDKNHAVIAGKKAFVVNRIGDFGFLIGLFLIFTIYDSVDFDHLMNVTNVILHQQEITLFTISHKPIWWFNLIGCCLFVGACGKSAQIPLFVWLPDAMAGPTPVSALIHAATMVTSGLYMITRMNFIYLNAPLALNLILIVGSITSVIAASIGITQFDIKKVLAYSTVSQLGFMFMGMGSGDLQTGMFHVFTHAFFKAALFLGSGSVILACHHEQDMRNMGGLRKLMPITFISMTIATLAIVGIFPLSGFFSKDEIFWKVFEIWYNNGACNGPILNLISWITGMIAAFMTAFYMSRLMIMTFFGDYRGYCNSNYNTMQYNCKKESYIPNEVSWTMWLPVAILAACSAFGGFLNVPHSLCWLGHNHFSSWLNPIIYKSTYKHHIDIHHSQQIMEYVLMIITTTIWTPFAMLLAWWFYIHDCTWSRPKWLIQKFPKIYKYAYAKYYIDEIYDKLIVNPCKNLSYRLFIFDTKVIDGIVNNISRLTIKNCYISDWFDANIIDNFINAIAWIFQQISNSFRKFQSGQWQNYAFIFYIGLLILILWKLFI